ncbi:SDR family NAD(P)-dependent oxidoreductase [Frankia tisae]|uniref:SDR family NAD(P)-dependent oxidoreductase n=1 Tax=Frankia tisae TaxID=2950104 RepID=UPI0021BE2C66|nr:SDR family NAD(P)-dependent oxidoreductase [Frankia tisae]
MSAARTVVVTGAAGGIGSEIVNRFLAHGDTVVASDLSPEALDTWRARWDADAPGGQHPSLHTVPADISNEQSVAALAQVVQQSLGTVDVLINNAGHFPQTAFEEMSTDEWRQVIDVNLTGTFLMIRSFVPLMKASGHGRIVNIGSGSVFSGTPMQSHYVASKGGVMGLTHVLARELGGYGITVNLITPGLTVTPAAAAVLPEALLAEQRSARALHRDETPEDLVGPIFFLASDDAAFITGQTLNVDGGRHLL